MKPFGLNRETSAFHLDRQGASTPTDDALRTCEGNVSLGPYQSASIILLPRDLCKDWLWAIKPTTTLAELGTSHVKVSGATCLHLKALFTQRLFEQARVATCWKLIGKTMCEFRREGLVAAGKHIVAG
jgi:hypothetical protein